MTEGLQRLWRSVGFRLAFYYGLLVAITMLAALAIVYLQTVGVLHQRMARQVTGATQQLEARFADGGYAAVAAEISRSLGDGRDSDNEIYLLADPEGRVLAGNLDAAPEGAPFVGGPSQRRVRRADRLVTGYLLARQLPDGGMLVVGHDLRDQEAIESLIASASAAAGIVAVLLLIGGTFVFRQELERSVGNVRRTAARIAAGELEERVAIGPEDDEFALLSRDINAMLDRIQSLMDGVRHVSNTIAHNLRTPLMRILARLHAAQRDEASPPERSLAIAAAMQEVEELTLVFEKLLQIAEAEAGARRQHFGPVDLQRIADDVMELYDAVAEAQGATLQREPADPATVLGDRDLLAGAVANLVDNALKYAGTGAVVRIGTRTAHGLALLTVQDDGPGIPAAELPRIGQRFHRLDRRLPGHGLGLASVQAVIALHGGRLELADAAPGLRATLELPAHHD